MRLTPLARLGSLALLLTILAGCGAAQSATPPADITITADGCSTSSFFLPAEREPQISIANQAAEPMVFTLPLMNEWVSLAPGQQADFALPRYIMGRFDFFCLSEAEHTAIAGGNPFLCVTEPQELAPVARSAGVFEIEQHNRIQEVTQGSP